MMKKQTSPSTQPENRCCVCGRRLRGPIYRLTGNRKCCEECYLIINPPRREKSISQHLREVRLMQEEEKARRQNTWQCDICGKSYIVTPTPHWFIHDEKKYCTACHWKWEAAQEQARVRAKEAEFRARAARMLEAFSAAGPCAPAAAGQRTLLSARLLTLDEDPTGNRGTLWVSVKGGKTELHRTVYSFSEFSGYHDEDNDYYQTRNVEKPEGWYDEDWFDSRQWIEKTRVPDVSSGALSLDALYYEGSGTVTTTRWLRRPGLASAFDGTLLVYLRRCAEGFRMLRISWPDSELPFTFDFTESTIKKLCSQYAEQCNVFQDFALTAEECAYIEDGLRGVERHTLEKVFEPRGAHVGFIRKSENGSAEESLLPEKALRALLRIRCLNEEDYWVYFLP